MPATKWAEIVHPEAPERQPLPTSRSVPRLGRVQTRNWLLALLVLGIVGMHGVAAGASGSAVHHAWTPTVSAVAPAVTAVDGPRVHVPAHGAAHGTVGQETEDGGSIALALCIWLLVGLAVGVAGARRTTWVATLDRLLRRLVLPAAPVLRERTPVPRFAVMRC